MAETKKDEQVQADPRVAELEAELAALRAQMAEAQAVPAPTEDMDETIPGGRYRVGDQWVNAEGQPIDSKGNVKE